MTTTKHSPTARLVPASDRPTAGVYGWVVMIGDHEAAKCLDRGDAALIVSAVNSHAQLNADLTLAQAANRELVEALRRAERLLVQFGPKDIDECDGYQVVVAALSKES